MSDPYERNARFVPAVLTILFAAPIAWAFDLPWSSWMQNLLGGVGIFALISVGLSHLASALGGRIQNHLWPRWPHDSPTNQWLHPNDTRCSNQQKTVLYGSIKRLTGLDIEHAIDENSPGDLEACINDAISELRNQLWNSEHSKRLQIHTRDYGFARNFCGFRPVWLFFAFTSAAASWWAWGFSTADLVIPIVATVEIIVALVLAFAILPNYVREKARHYAESFFAAVRAIDGGLDSYKTNQEGESSVKTRPV